MLSDVLRGRQSPQVNPKARQDAQHNATCSMIAAAGSKQQSSLDDRLCSLPVFLYNASTAFNFIRQEAGKNPNTQPQQNKNHEEASQDAKRTAERSHDRKESASASCKAGHHYKGKGQTAKAKGGNGQEQEWAKGRGGRGKLTPLVP